MPNNSKNTGSSNNNNNNRGRFILGRSAPSLRRPQKKSNKTYQKSFLRKNNSGRIEPGLSPLRENGVSRPPQSQSTFNVYNEQEQPHPKKVSFQNRSESPIATKENVDATGFSRLELHDLEESFRLFDIYGEECVQVGDLRGILEVLRQEQQQQQQQQQFSGSKYPHLKTLLNRLSELSDEDTLTLDDYIQLMASTTISNSVIIENGSKADDDASKDHFAHVFQLFDSDEKGYITLKDLERIALELGEHDMTRGELQEMIEQAVGGRDGNDGGNAEKTVGIDDFTRMMTMSLFASGDVGVV